MIGEYDYNVERGDTFVVEHDMLRGNHFTCVGVHDDHFYAGDSGGRMWKFKRLAADPSKIRVFVERGDTWARRATVYEEDIIGGI